MNGGQEIHPIRAYASYEMNCAVFLKNFGNLVYIRIDGRMGGQTSRYIKYSPIQPSVERGYN